MHYALMRTAIIPPATTIPDTPLSVCMVLYVNVENECNIIALFKFSIQCP